MTQQHYPLLDGLRGLAFAGVYLFHLGPGIQITESPWLWSHILEVFNYGWMGVELFFVLSGFLITGILYNTKQDRDYFTNFYARRTLRIFPLYYSVLACVAALSFTVPALADFKDVQFWYWIYLQNWLPAIAPQYEGQTLTHFWSLAIEEQFYLCWPLVVWCLKRNQLMVLCAAIILISPVSRAVLVFTEPSLFPRQLIYFSTFTRIDCLACGALIALATPVPKWLMLNALRMAIPCLCGIGMVIWYDRGHGNSAMTAIGLSFVSLLAASIILYGLEDGPGWGKAILRSRFLRKLGKHSYALYVLHWPVLRVTNSLLETMNLGDTSRIIALVILATGTTYGMSLATWHLIEKRCLSYKGLFEPKTLTSPPQSTLRE